MCAGNSVNFPIQVIVILFDAPFKRVCAGKKIAIALIHPFMFLLVYRPPKKGALSVASPDAAHRRILVKYLVALTNQYLYKTQKSC